MVDGVTTEDSVTMVGGVSMVGGVIMVGRIELETRCDFYHEIWMDENEVSSKNSFVEPVLISHRAPVQPWWQSHTPFDGLHEELFSQEQTSSQFGPKRPLRHAAAVQKTTFSHD